MTSEERRELRYQRRKNARLLKYQQKFQTCLNYDEIFTFDHLYNSYKKCCCGVGWKSSTQRYKISALTNVATIHKQLQQGTFTTRGFHEFDIMERGKPRHIQSVHISERVVQRCLCDYCLVPILSNSFIYDNGASLKNKGVDFAMNRMKLHLHRYYHTYKTNVGYILQFDFSKYFDRIVHKILYLELDKRIEDARLRKIIHQFVDVFGAVGLGLGSQVSQICALIYPNKLDHLCKDTFRLKWYGRYMDDGYIIHPDKQQLRQCLESIRQLCDELGIVLNEKKTIITRIDKPFVFLKHRFCLTSTGKIICKARKYCSSQYRRKFRKLKSKQLECKVDCFYVQQVLQSVLGHLRKSNSYNLQRNLFWYCQRLFNSQLKIKGGKYYRPLFYLSKSSYTNFSCLTA